MLSILIPIYNRNVVKLITGLHHSGEKAKCNFEILAYEDGSTKFLHENSELSKLTYCNYLPIAKNQGRSAIRNRLGQDAQYQYLLFIDCDAALINDDFVGNYLKYCDPQTILIGGISYQGISQKSEYSLRLKYGVRETASATERSKTDYLSHFTTFNFLIPNPLFQSIYFDQTLQGYGYEDTIFGVEIATKHYNYLHIDNPLIHLGVEENAIFLQKNVNAVRNLCKLYRSDKRPDILPHSKILQLFDKMNKMKIVSLFAQLSKPLLPLLQKNLLSASPSLVIFDLYKLIHLTRAYTEK